MKIWENAKKIFLENSNSEIKINLNLPYLPQPIFLKNWSHLTQGNFARKSLPTLIISDF